MTDGSEIFDRSLLRRRRDRAARGFSDHDFLVREIASRLSERLDEVKRDFASTLLLDCRGGILGDVLSQNSKVSSCLQCDLSPAFAREAAKNGLPTVVADEEFQPFAPASFDLVVSCLGLQWVNDLPGALLQIARILKPDGLFIGALVGGDSLFELRQCLTAAELNLEGGASPRVAPFVDLRQAGALLQRAGFALPLADRDRLVIDYGDPFKLLADLRGMGATSVLKDRRRQFLRRETLMTALSHYHKNFARPDGRLTATLEIFYLTAWAPAPSQPKALRPGSAAKRLADALETVEMPSGDRTRPH